MQGEGQRSGTEGQKKVYTGSSHATPASTAKTLTDEPSGSVKQATALDLACDAKFIFRFLPFCTISKENRKLQDVNLHNRPVDLILLPPQSILYQISPHLPIRLHQASAFGSVKRSSIELALAKGNSAARIFSERNNPSQPLSLVPDTYFTT